MPLTHLLVQSSKFDNSFNLWNLKKTYETLKIVSGIRNLSKSEVVVPGLNMGTANTFISSDTTHFNCNQCFRCYVITFKRKDVSGRKC